MPIVTSFIGHKRWSFGRFDNLPEHIALVTWASDAQPGSASHQALLHRVRRGVHFVVVAAIVWVVILVIAGILFSDQTAVARFERAGPYIAAMTLMAFAANHLLRFARWQWMLVRLGARVPTMANLAIFMAGLGLVRLDRQMPVGVFDGPPTRAGADNLRQRSGEKYGSRGLTDEYQRELLSVMTIRAE